MNKNPWMKFYPKDWKADTALRMCPLSARGLWIEMLCIMHDSDRYGHLIVSGRILDDVSLAALIGASTQEVSDNLRHLERADVFTRSRDGAIYSRKMVRDYKRSNVNRKNVKKRWENDNAEIVETKEENINRNTNRNTRKKPEARRLESKKEQTPSGVATPKRMRFEGHVVRLDEQAWNTWRVKFSLTDEQLGELMIERDDFLKKLPESDRRRSRWFMPTFQWLTGEVENLMRSI